MIAETFKEVLEKALMGSMAEATKQLGNVRDLGSLYRVSKKIILYSGPERRDERNKVIHTAMVGNLKAMLPRVEKVLKMLPIGGKYLFGEKISVSDLQVKFELIVRLKNLFCRFSAYNSKSSCAMQLTTNMST